MFGCRKTFSGKYIFSGNANFRKKKIFLCVWLYFKKFSGKYFLVFGKEGGKHKPRKHTSHNPEKLRSRRREIAINVAISRRRDLAFAISRSTLREIAPSIAISIRRDLAKARSRSTARSREASIAVVGLVRARGLELGLEIGADWSSDWSSPLARALSLSLSLFSEIL